VNGGERAYPLPAAALDVAKVLEAHGYPPVRAGLDWVELQQALYGFLYVAGGAR
jgi:hypothetical protein